MVQNTTGEDILLNYDELDPSHENVRGDDENENENENENEPSLRTVKHKIMTAIKRAVTPNPQRAETPATAPCITPVQRLKYMDYR